MAQVTVAQSVEDTAGGNPSLTGVTSGNFLVVSIKAGRYFGLTPSISSVSGGSAGWTLRQITTSSEVGTFHYTSRNNTSSTVTLTISGTYDEIIATLIECSSGDNYDTGSTNSGASGTALTSGSTGTLSSDENLAIVGVHVESGFTTFTHNGGLSELDEEAGGGYSTGTSALEVTSTTALNASVTSTSSAPWTCAITVVKPVASAATSLPPLYLPSRSNRALLRR